ncbi:MAG TPA: peptidylprolyl isomerase [Myxococcota bacterium]|nr:peptidylprolyl isomerase [Myxococcota bacterium]
MPRPQIPLAVRRAATLCPIALALCLGAAHAVAEQGADHAATAQPTDAAIAAIDAFIAEQKVDTTQPDWKSELERPPKVGFTPGKTYFWLLETNKGKIKIALMPDVAPMHVSSTIYLTRLGFYDDTIFHRVIPRFMAQGGDPTGTGRGGPGYKYEGEFDASVKHSRPGLLSMANAGPDTDGSQFFITFVATPHLNGKHTIFGRVVEGMDTVKELEKFGSRSGSPREELKLEKATIAVEGGPSPAGGAAKPGASGA